ncbi:hypothetical protein PY257_04470 [Ramlibacter sp. H39-3-26]|uniref:hypothetical protein n=1 Tax=Curvibacter soli TaxID=3031331 RepID=UPI0023DC7D6F|nr:hypothetical protein [Ramlibacter sp. H39-3-26]MDF1484439.1 hypothetical protein [Ramlibacter sp. H39-3-26]
MSSSSPYSAAPACWRIPLAMALAVCVLAAWLGALDAAAARQTDAGLQRALASFATARALNAVVSVAQGTQLAVQPAGVGTTLAVGQALAPVKDLVEQFSSVMLVASVSFGVQKLLIAIGGYWAVSLALTLLALAWAACLWRRAVGAPAWLSRLLLGLLLVRFAVPVAALGSDAAFRLFMHERYEAGQAVVAQSQQRIGALQTQDAPPEAGGLGQRLRQWWDRAAEGMDMGQRYAQLKQAAEQAVARMVDLIVVFVLQTVALPLLLLWLLGRLARALLVPRARGAP